MHAGLTEEGACELLGVHPSVLYNEKNRNPELRDMALKAKRLADLDVVSALHKRCIGYEHDHEEIRTVGVGDGMSAIERVKVVKRYAPSERAIEFWLTNRDPESWRKTSDLNVTSKLEDMSEEDLDKRLNSLLELSGQANSEDPESEDYDEKSED